MFRKMHCHLKHGFIFITLIGIRKVLNETNATSAEKYFEMTAKEIGYTKCSAIYIELEKKFKHGWRLEFRQW